MTSRLLPAFLFAVTFAGGVLLACSSTDSSTFTPTPKEAGPDGPGPLLPDSGGGEGGEGGGACVVDVPANFQSEFTAPKQVANACQTTDIDGYWTSCLQNIREPNHDAVCDAWVLANASCAACIQPQDNSGAVLWLTYGGPKFYQINVGGCIALVLGDNSPQGCGALTHDTGQCTWQACGKCDNPLEPACRTDARAAGVCASKNNVRSQVCGTSDASRNECTAFGDTRAAFVGIATKFCGP